MSTTASGDRASTLAAELHSTGALPVECSQAFLAVPRECFIPDRTWVQEIDDGPYEPIDRVVEPERWLRNVNSDRVIVTQFDDGVTEWPQTGYRPTCSASMPSVVAGMLSALDIRPGHSVLEIGTGTGYNAALIAELVGRDGEVTTIEIDGRVGAAAHDRLAAAGFSQVHTLVADAVTATVAGRFDRVIVTAAVRLARLPHSWVAATRVGGHLLAPMRADLAAGPVVHRRWRRDGARTRSAVAPGRLHGDPIPTRGYPRLRGAVLGRRLGCPIDY